MNDILDVYLDGRLVGHLKKDNAQLSFQYVDDYIKQENAKPLSSSLPVNDEIFGNDFTEPFFSGLLPDDLVRTRVARILQISAENTFSMLKAIGGDCAGAISLYPHKIHPHRLSEPEYRILEDDEAFEILNNLDKRPLGIGEDDFRISGAGAQDKLLACLLDNGKIALPLHGTPSTHIIKTPIAELDDTVHNEIFCMQLARLCGFNIPLTRVKKINSKPFYIVDRYDRIRNSKGYFDRIHQEDFCQALNIDPKNKYESEGGPSLLDCYALMNNIGLSAADKIAFTDMLVFNFLIGNGDAHAKNFSILYRSAMPELAPFYDLMSSKIYHHPLKHKMAMKICGKGYLSEYVSSDNFRKLANEIGFKEDYMLSRVGRIRKRILDFAVKLKEEFNHAKRPHLNSGIYDKIIRIIQHNAERLESK